jgi:hypothetical protein
MGAERNVADAVETIRAIKDLGGRVVSVEGGKHVKIRAVTRMGNPVTLRVSKSKTDPHKLKGWTRQELNRADAAPASNRRSHGNN